MKPLCMTLCALLLALFCREVAAAPIVVPHPDDATGACQDRDFQLMLSLQGRASESKLELDRRLALVLAEERRVQAEQATAPTGWRRVALPGLLGLIGLVAALFGGVRRLWPSALLGALFCAGGGALLARGAEVNRLAEARVGELRDCRIRLWDARNSVMLSELSHCIYVTEEAIEDLLDWEGKLRVGQLTSDHLQKLRHELSGR